MWHQVKPDIDNLLKTLFDGLGDAKWFAVGDQQIAYLEASKVYVTDGGKPGVLVDIWQAIK